MKAVESLQRQRAAALTAQARAEDRAAADSVRRAQHTAQQISRANENLTSTALRFLPGGNALSDFIRIGEDLARVRSEGQAAKAVLSGVGEGALVAESGLLAMAGPVAIVAAGLAILTGGAIAASAVIYGLAKSAAEATGRFVDMRQETGFQVETLSALDLATQTTGGNIQSITASLGIFSKNMEAAAQGQKKMSSLFAELNINTQDNERALVQAFIALGNMEEGAQQTALALQLFGRGGKDVLAIIKETGGNLDEAKKKFAEMGLLISTDVAEAGDKAGDSFRLFELQVEALQRRIAEQFIPAALVGVEQLSTLLEQNQVTFNEWGEVTKSIALGLVDAIGALVQSIRLLIDVAILALAPFIALEAVMLSVVKTVFYLIDAVVALLTGDFSRFKTDLQAIADSGDNLVSTLQSIANWARRAGADAREAWGWIAGLAQQDAFARDVRRAGGQPMTPELKDRIMRGEFAGRSPGGVRVPSTQGGGGGGGKAKDRTGEIRKEFDLEIKEQERHYRKELEALRRIHDLEEGEIDRFAADAKKLEEDRYKAISEIYSREIIALPKLREELNLKLRDLEDEKNRNIQKIEDAAAKERLQNFRQLFEQTERLQAESGKRSLALTKEHEEKGLITHEQAQQQRAAVEAEGFKRRWDQLQEELKQTDENSREHARIQEKLNLLEQQRTTFQAEQIRLRKEARDKDLAEEQERLRKLQEIEEELDALRKRLAGEGPESETIDRRLHGDPLEGIFRTDPGAILNPWLGAIANLKGTALDAIKSMAQGAGSLLNTWTLYGTVGPNAVRKMTAAILGQLAAEATVQAIMETARGVAALANPFTAWQAPFHFKAAALYSLVAAGSALAGRAIAKSAFSSQGGGEGAGGSGGGEGTGEARNYPAFNYGGGTSPASQSAGTGSRTFWAAQMENLKAAIDGLNNKIGSIPQDHIITNNPNAVGDALNTALDNSHPISRNFYEKSGFRG